MRSSRRRSSGFTLIEILVTVAILALVVGIAGAALLGTARSAPRTRVRAEEEAELIRVESVLRRQIITLANAADGTAAVASRRGTEPRTDGIDMVTRELLYSGGVGEAQWKIEHDPGAPPYLAYLESPYVGADTTGHHPWIPFSRLITGMAVRYRQHDQWTDQWTQAALPERIRITLWFDTPDETDADASKGGETIEVEAAPGLEAESDLAGPSAGASPSASPVPGLAPSPSSAAPSPAGNFVPGGGAPPGASPPGGMF